MTPFIMDDHFRAEMARIKKNAEANPYPLDKFKLRMSGELHIPGELAAFSAVLEPFGWKIVYTIEEMPTKFDENQGFWVHHLSVSSPDVRREPNEFTMMEIMKELGMGDEFWAGGTWSEKVPTGGTAINVLVPYQRKEAHVSAEPAERANDYHR